MRRGCDPAVFEYVVNELANERQLAENATLLRIGCSSM